MRPISDGDGVLRVMTLNIWARKGSWRDRRNVLINGLEALRPDVIAFQEVIRADRYDQVHDLVGSRYHIVHHSSRGDDGAGISTATRWQPTASHELGLDNSSQSGPSSVALVVELAPPGLGGKVLVVNHKPVSEWHAEARREQQAVLAARAVEQLSTASGAQVIVAGDFDASPDSASVRFWTGRQSLEGTSVCYRDAWYSRHGDRPGHTFSPTNPLVYVDEPTLDRGRRTDYLMVRCDDRGPSLLIHRCDLAFDQADNGTWASDHFGVVADLGRPVTHPQSNT
ncbi:endonuclease/exonuclease/phosphatase family protein [Micromonospora chokoriensis]